MTNTDHQAQHTESKVYLIGAGPGDPELLTRKAYRLLQQTQVVLYDALVAAEILALIPESVVKIAVGKRCGQHSLSQAEINALIIEQAHQYQHVVRLKGGDPFIFGRGGEEIQDLKQANLLAQSLTEKTIDQQKTITYEVVPGITAASGAAAAAQIPLTHRDCAQSVSFITGHCQPNGKRIDWSRFANAEQTLVIYMGITHAPDIMDGLLTAGRAANTPVAIISKATTPMQQTFSGQLAQLGSLSRLPQLTMPALIIIGEVVTVMSQHNLKL